MKNIDVKSLIIGALLTSTIFLGVAATSPTDKWDEKQNWEFTEFNSLEVGRGEAKGWECIGPIRFISGLNNCLYRRRTK